MANFPQEALLGAIIAKNKGLPQSFVQNAALGGMVGGGVGAVVVADRTYRDVKTIADERETARVERDVEKARAEIYKKERNQLRDWIARPPANFALGNVFLFDDEKSK